MPVVKKTPRSAQAQNPFGKESRLLILQEYFETAGEVTIANAWEHVYKCLLWMDEATNLAHIYDSNHMQPGHFFHGRAVRFTDALCREWGITKRELPSIIDRLFKGCVVSWREGKVNSVGDTDEELESEFRTSIASILQGEGVREERAGPIARRIEAMSRDYFTVGNKRKNALGEGFEDLLWLLLQRVAKVPSNKLSLRTPVSRLPGFRKALPKRAGQRPERQPSPDLAFYEGDITHVIVTAKWSIRQDRETQFQSEFSAYQRTKIQTAELNFALITNEFDVARLDNIARAIPTGAGGYIFHTIYHINPTLLRETQADKLGALAHWMGAGKIRSLADFLTEMQGRFGNP